MLKSILLVVIFWGGLGVVVFGQTNLITSSELGTVGTDLPKLISLTTDISVTLPYGDITIQKGDRLSVLSVNRGSISVLLMGGMTNAIPVTATDIVEQINSIRSHRLIVGKEQYEKYRCEAVNPSEVKGSFTQTGLLPFKLRGYC